MTTKAYRCIKCGSTDLVVTIETRARLIQEPDGNLQTDIWDYSANHTWDHDSDMTCSECGHQAAARDFYVENAS